MTHWLHLLICFLFRSVFMEISRFMVAYIFLIIGFMMSFSILFADQEQFQSFPAMFVKVRIKT